MQDHAKANKRCGARTRGGGQCKRWPVDGRSRCRAHGGATPRGTASPHFKHGRYSTVLSVRVNEKYQQAAYDPDFLTHAAELHLIDTRIAVLCQELAGEHASEIWAQISRWLDLRVKTLNSELARRKTYGSMIDAEEFLSLAGSLSGTIRRVLLDNLEEDLARRLLSKINEAFQSVMAHQPATPRKKTR